MFKELDEINNKPEPFQFYTAKELWSDEHTSKKMLEYHLNETMDLSSRNIKFIEKSVEWIIKKFNLNENSKLIDFGCGPGLYTTRFAKKGIKTTGIDFSKRSLNYAKELAAKNSLQIDYFHKNYLEFKTKDKYDLITLIMCDFCALSPSQRNILLSNFREIIKPTGSILLDVYTTTFYDQKDELHSYEFNYLDNFWSADDYYCFINSFKYDKEKVVLDKYTIFEKNKRKRTIYNWLQCFSIESLVSELNENGFNIAEVYTDVAGKKYHKSANEIAIVGKLVT